MTAPLTLRPSEYPGAKPSRRAMPRRQPAAEAAVPPLVALARCAPGFMSELTDVELIAFLATHCPDVLPPTLRAALAPAPASPAPQPADDPAYRALCEAAHHLCRAVSLLAARAP